MPIAPREWLEFAKSLGGQSEASCRSAASRAYYGAYHAAQRVAETLPAPADTNCGMHELVIRTLMECPIKASTKPRDLAVRRIGVLLMRARDGRTAADYDTRSAFPSQRATETIEVCEDIFAKIDALPPP
jgi:uncharacterized protein (UPF0332 family)